MENARLLTQQLDQYRSEAAEARHARNLVRAWLYPGSLAGAQVSSRRTLITLSRKKKREHFGSS